MFFDDVDGYIEENNWIKYLVFAPTGKNKEALKNYTKLWEENKRQIEAINDDEPIKYRNGFMKIRFESDDHLVLGKIFNIVDMINVVVSVLEKNAKYYPQSFLHECAYKLKEWIASKECMLCHYWYFKDVGFKFGPHFCNESHEVLMTAYELKNIAILKVKGVDFRCILWGIIREEAVNRMNNSLLEDKGVL